MSRTQLVYTMVIAAALYVPIGNAQSASYPESALHEVIKESAAEEAKAKEAEEKSVAERERYERRVRQVKQEIANKRYEIEGYKMRQDKAQQELAGLAVSISDLDARLQSLSDEHHEFNNNTAVQMRDLEAQRKEYTEKQKSLDFEIAELSKARKRAERAIVNQSMEVQSMKAGIARLEASKAELESKTAEMEADEMKVRTEWMQTKLAVAENTKQRDEANAHYTEAKAKRDSALKDLQVSQGDLAKAQRDRNEAMKKAEAEVAKFEKEIASAHRARIASESEQIRLDAEVAKIREYVVRMKESHDDALEQADKSSGLVLKSTLNLETARSELARSVAASDKNNFENQKESARARGIAAAAEAADMVQQIAANSPAPRKTASAPAPQTPSAVKTTAANGRRLWVTNANCTAYEKPDKGARAVGFLNEGEHFSSLPAKKAGWVRIYSPAGTIYVEGTCGKYENE